MHASCKCYSDKISLTLAPIIPPAEFKLGSSNVDNTFEGFTFVDQSSQLHSHQPPGHASSRQRTMVDHMEHTEY